MSYGFSPTDPYILDDSFSVANAYLPRRYTGPLALRGGIDPTKKTLVLLCAGQSNISNVVPTRVAPTNASVIDQLNIYDGALYSVDGALLGASNDDATHGCVAPQVADKFITAGTFDRVILVGLGVNTSTVSMWSTGSLSSRIPVALKRLAARGITPATTGVTFAMWWAQGESDHGTTLSAYQSGLNAVRSSAVSAGFSGRIFVCKQSLLSGAIDTTVQSAQTGTVDNVNFWSGGDMDALSGTNRQVDNTHWSDTGAPNCATAVYNAMHASGAPF